MTRRQARVFAIISTAIVVIAFLGLTVDSHRQFPALTNEDKLTPEVIAGKDVWHKYNCTNCHGLLGEGAYYAPDLTKIAQQRGRPYLKAFMQDPSRFYDEQKVRRVMPKQNLSDREIDDLISFLGWIAEIDTQGWPPRPILVAGAAIPGTTGTTRGDAGYSERATSGEESPIAKGQALFNATPPACFACHSVAPGVQLAGPSLAGLATRAEQILASKDYMGKAQDIAGYIRESIVDPHAHIPGDGNFGVDGRSLMPDNFDEQLRAEQIDQLVAYLESLK
jgi:nitric oxide reductase subunit C